MAKKQYGIMPPFPHLLAMLRGSQYRHFFLGDRLVAQTHHSFARWEVGAGAD